MAGRVQRLASFAAVVGLVCGVLTTAAVAGGAPTVGASPLDDPTTTTVAPSSTTTTVAPTVTTVAPSTTTTTTTPVSTTPSDSSSTTSPPSTAPSPSTTTAPAPGSTTTTTLPHQHLKVGVPKVPTGGGASKKAKPPSGVGPIPTTAGPSIIGIADDMGELTHLEDYEKLESLAATQQHQVATSGAALSAMRSGVADAQRTVHRAGAGAAQANSVLAQVALAAYTGGIYQAQGVATAGIGLQGQEAADADTLLNVAVDHIEAAATSADQRLRLAGATLDGAHQRLMAAAGRLVAAQHRAAGTRQAMARDAAIVRAGVTTPPQHNPAGPPILGTPVLTAQEVSGWYDSTGASPTAGVPLDALARDYIRTGTATGVRGDIAFTQSIIETGWFSFPAHGQLTAADHNYAGIGACDSCQHGWSFASAANGVAAQIELLDAYASSTPVATPLVGPVYLGGCCTTWTALSRHWATNLVYGAEILGVYRQMLDWAVRRRVRAAGL